MTDHPLHERIAEIVRKDAWAQGNGLRDIEVARRTATAIMALVQSEAPTDEAIRALVRSVAQATVELVAERLVNERLGHIASGVGRSKHTVASLIVTATMADADEDPEAPLNALRRLP